MAFPAARDPHRVPIHVLFPESYEASKRETARDFVLFGSAIVLAVVLAASVNLFLAAAI